MLKKYTLNSLAPLLSKMAGVFKKSLAACIINIYSEAKFNEI